MTPIPVTVVIPVKNEERNLPACLAKLGSFNEILIVDSDSEDRTRQIAKTAGTKLINFVWQGGFPKKRNWVLLNYKFTTPWVLFLDADEHLTEVFLQEARAKILQEKYDGYWLNYRNHFLGRVLKFGVPQRKLALFKVGAGLYERIDDARWSELDMEVHEHPVLQGQVGEIHAPIDHVDFRGLHHFIDRHNSYSTWEANRYLQLSASPEEVTATDATPENKVSTHCTMVVPSRIFRIDVHRSRWIFGWARRLSIRGIQNLLLPADPRKNFGGFVA